MSALPPFARSVWASSSRRSNLLRGRSPEIVDEPEHFVAICARQRADAETALDKLVAETALLALVARSAADPALIATLVAQLLRLARNERHRALILADPRAAAGLSFAHAALSRLGAPDPSFDRLLSPGLAHSATAVERPVFRAMEQRWISALLRGDFNRSRLRQPSRAQPLLRAGQRF